MPDTDPKIHVIDFILDQVETVPSFFSPPFLAESTSLSGAQPAGLCLVALIWLAPVQRLDLSHAIHMPAALSRGEVTLPEFNSQ